MSFFDDFEKRMERTRRWAICFCALFAVSFVVFLGWVLVRVLMQFGVI